MEHIAVFLSISCILIWTLIVSTDSIYQKISVPIWSWLADHIVWLSDLLCSNRNVTAEINWEVKSSGTAI